KASPPKSSLSTDVPGDRVVVGRVVRPHGLRGAVVVEVFTDRPHTRFAPGEVVELSDGTTLTVAAFKTTARLPLVTFEEAPDRDAAGRLRGQELFIPAEKRRPLEEDERWPDELGGAEVGGPDGQRIGRVVDVEVGVRQGRAGGDLGGGIISGPFVREIVPEVEGAGRRVVSDPPPGLID